MTGPRALDAAAVLVVFALSSWVGYRFAADHGLVTLGHALRPAVMIACGHSLSVPATVSPAFEAFARRERDVLRCEDVGGPGSSSINSFVQGYRYAVYASGAALRIGGLSWHSIDWLLGALFGISMALSYVLLRFVAGPALSLAGVAFLACSDHITGLTADLRDYGKEVWFLAVWVALAWIVARGRARDARAVTAPCALAGALIGLGLGFRLDLLVVLPMVVAAPFLAVPGWRDALLYKARAAALAIAAFLVTGAPILLTLSEGSNTAHVAVLGLMTPFNRGLGMAPAPYDIGHLYSDGFARTVIAAHTGLLHGGGPAPLGTAQYDRQGARLLRSIATIFPADLMMRATAATRQVLDHPFRHRNDEDFASVGGSPRFVDAVLWRNRAVAAIDGFGIAIVAVALFVVTLRNPRNGILLLIFVFYFCAYSVVQFSRRHTFHLDVIAIGVVVAALAQVPALVMHPVQTSRNLRAAVVSLMICAAVGAAMWGVLRLWQQREINQLLDATLALGWQDVRWDTQATPGDRAVLRPQVAHSTGIGEELWFNYWLVEVGGAACRATSVPLGVTYKATEPTADWDYTRQFDIPVAAGSLTTLLVPTFTWTGQSEFVGLELPGPLATSCVQNWRRATAIPPEPVLVAMLPAGWRGSTSAQRIDLAARVPLESLWLTAPRQSDASFAVESLPNTMDLASYASTNAKSVSGSGDGLLIEGDDSDFGYQVMSPPVAVPPDQTLIVQVESAIDAGQVCFGILDGAQQRWLLAPETQRTQYKVNTLRNTRVWFVFANCEVQQAAGRRPTRFRIHTVRYGFGRGGDVVSH